MLHEMNSYRGTAEYIRYTLFHYVLLIKVQTEDLVFLQRLQSLPSLATGLLATLLANHLCWQDITLDSYLGHQLGTLLPPSLDE
jgi:hypothetical protein